MTMHAEHFDSPERQAHAAKLGMWTFLASEVLLFGGLFTLYSAQRLVHPAAFLEGSRHMEVTIGTINTAILLTSSFVVALCIPMIKADRRGLTTGLLGLAMVMGAAFVALKLTEYGDHFKEGIWPGGKGNFFLAHPDRGLRIFFTLYYVMTGLHAIHVLIGMSVLGWMAVRVWRGTINAENAYVIEVGALYWHLVDVVWIFLWPVFYLLRGGS